jgi:RNA polymerase sigma-70 factor, ECF subfamily
MSLTSTGANETPGFEPDFESVVESFYEGLYRFALSLSHNESEAGDLTQQAFYIWAIKGSQIRDSTKVKSWLYTTLYRDFLKTRTRQGRFMHHELSEVEHELPGISPSVVNKMDYEMITQAFKQVDDVYRPPLALYFLEDYTYQQIADILAIPIGTVMSRISRGKAQLQRILATAKPINDAGISEARIIQHG